MNYLTALTMFFLLIFNCEPSNAQSFYVNKNIDQGGLEIAANLILKYSFFFLSLMMYQDGTPEHIF